MSSTGAPRRALAALLSVLVVALTVLGARYADGWPTDSRIATWAGRSAGLDVLRDDFGGDEAVLVRVSGSGLERGEAFAWAAGLAARLRAEPAVSECLDPLHLPGARASQDASALERLQARPLVRALDLVDAAAARVDLLLAVRPGAAPSERASLAGTVEALRAEAAEHGLRLAAAGHPLLATALDEEARRIERRFVPLLVGCALLAAALFLRSIVLGLLALAPALLASTAARSAMRALGWSSNLVLVALGPLVLVLVLASVLHLLCAYRRHRAAGADPAAAARGARAEILPAALLAAATTAVGFGVFALSGVEAVRRLGAAVAATLVLAVPLAYGLLHVVLGALPDRGATRRSAPRHRRGPALACIRHRAAFAAGAALLLVLGALAPRFLEWRTNALTYFPRGHPVRAEFLAIEGSGAALTTLEVLVRRPDGAPLDPARLAAAGLAPRLAALPEVVGCFGPETVLADLRAVAGPAATAVLPGALRTARRLSADGRCARWTVRLPSGDHEDIERAASALERCAAGWAREQQLEAGVVGSMLAVFGMQRALIGTLAGSLSLTCLVTTLLLALVARRPRDLAAALVVNLCPVAAVLTCAWWLGIGMDASTVMVAAIVLGMSVDNTFHVLHHAAGGPAPGSARRRLRALERVVEPATVATIALSAGFAVLGASGFAPTARFGLLTALGVLVAWVGDFLLLPALWVAPRRARRD